MKKTGFQKIKAQTETGSRLLSLILIAVLLICAIPFSATAEVRTEGLLETDASIEELYGEALDTAELSADDIPEGMSVQMVSEKGHVKRLREQEDDLQTVIFQNRSGHKTAYYYNRPVKYVDENGDVKDKSTDISEAGKKLSKQYAYTALENDVKSYFPQRVGNGVKVTFGEYEISFYPLSTSVSTSTAGQKAETLSGADPETRDRVVYDGIFGDGTRLQYTPCFEGLKEDIVLLEYTGKNVFRFVYKTDGLCIVEENGILALVEPTTDIKVGEIQRIISYDANGKRSLGILSAAEIIANEEYVVTVTVDADFLQSAETAYPVYVDPTVDIYKYGEDDGEQRFRELVMYQPSTVSMTNSNDKTLLGYDYLNDCSTRLLYGFDSDYLTTAFVNKIYYAQVVSAHLYIYTVANDNQNVKIYPYDGSWPTDSNNDGFTYASDAYFDNYYEEYYNSLTIPDGYRGYYAYNFDQVLDNGWVCSRSAWINGLVIVNNSETSSNEGDYLELYLNDNMLHGNIYFSIDYSERPIANNLIMTSDNTYDYLNNADDVPALSNPSSNVSTHKWNIKYVGNGEYVIKNQGASKALEASGTSVILSTYWSSSTPRATLRWEVFNTNSGYTFFMNVGTGGYLIYNNSTLSMSATNTNKKYLWNMYRPVRVTGSPVAYEPAKWNQSSAKLTTNCYAYMLNNQFIPHDSSITDPAPNYYTSFMQPGQSVIGTTYDGDYVPALEKEDFESPPNTILEYVGYDAEVYGFTFEPIGRDGICPSGTYKVALVLSVYEEDTVSKYGTPMAYDYHWYRQNPDGTWSHKPGRSNVINTDYSGNVIYDPELADRDTQSHISQDGERKYLDYELFIGYYYVTPMGNMLPSS